MIKNFENPIISIKFSGKKPMSFQDFLEKYNDKANEFMSMIKNNIPLKVIKEQTGLNINNYSFAP